MFKNSCSAEWNNFGGSQKRQCWYLFISPGRFENCVGRKKTKLGREFYRVLKSMEQEIRQNNMSLNIYLLLATSYCRCNKLLQRLVFLNFKEILINNLAVAFEIHVVYFRYSKRSSCIIPTSLLKPTASIQGAHWKRIQQNFYSSWQKLWIRNS